jgi:hypothetical protein
MNGIPRIHSIFSSEKGGCSLLNYIKLYIFDKITHIIVKATHPLLSSKPKELTGNLFPYL